MHRSLKIYNAYVGYMISAQAENALRGQRENKTGLCDNPLRVLSRHSRRQLAGRGWAELGLRMTPGTRPALCPVSFVPVRIHWEICKMRLMLCGNGSPHGTGAGSGLSCVHVAARCGGDLVDSARYSNKECKLTIDSGSFIQYIVRKYTQSCTLLRLFDNLARENRRVDGQAAHATYGPEGK
jgi:hypothetical protein